jgi:DNA replication ATP-dependent helicase Dna2
LSGTKTVPTRPFPGLRPAQIGAFSLVRWQTSFLWGPPGTGKTHTLGRLLASYLVHYPGERVLLLSSTNVAVDLAIIAVDDAIRELGPAIRPICYRFGSRLEPSRFRGREHLTPLRDKTLIQMLRQLQDVAPDPANAELYQEWKRQRDRLRDAIRTQNHEFLSKAQLAAMTTTLAAHDFSNLSRFDLVVFDEASQVGKAQAMTFAQLGDRVLFAGDHKQLAPIAVAPQPDVTTWLADSPFAWSGRNSLAKATCMLNEQWRMAPAISAAISSQFYESKLHVALPAAADAKWLQRRVVRATTLLDLQNVVLIDTEAAPTVARGFRGYVCPESARLIAALVVDHAKSWAIRDLKSEMLVLTPYRAQRRRLEDELSAIGVPRELASTVHRAQGSERRLVLFDPVCPTAEFVSNEEGMRLVNVAFSRAECRLIVMLQRGWERHPVLRALAAIHRPVTLDPQAVDDLLLAAQRLALPAQQRIEPADWQRNPGVQG